MKRFNKMCLNIQNLPTETTIIDLINNLRKKPFNQSI
ncbi:hypothetical protein DF186_13905 [Enterococcus hirae]|nr:hypothetical protein DF186_13905 [Enterococcus hirae]